MDIHDRHLIRAVDVKNWRIAIDRNIILHRERDLYSARLITRVSPLRVLFYRTVSVILFQGVRRIGARSNNENDKKPLLGNCRARSTARTVTEGSDSAREGVKPDDDSSIHPASQPVSRQVVVDRTSARSERSIDRSSSRVS